MTLFTNLNNEQKCSIINFLIALISEEPHENELQLINDYVHKLSIKKNDAISQLQMFGIDKITNDFREFNYEQIEFIVALSFFMVGCSGQFNENAAGFSMNFFENLGIENNKYLDIASNAKTIINKYNII